MTTTTPEKPGEFAIGRSIPSDTVIRDVHPETWGGTLVG